MTFGLVPRVSFIKLTAHGAFKIYKRSWRPVRKLEMKTAMDLPFNHVPEKRLYAKRLEKLYQQMQSGYLLFFRLLVGVVLLYYTLCSRAVFK